MPESQSVQRRKKLLPGGQPPAVPRHEAVDLALRQHVQRIESDFLKFLGLVQECLAGKFYERFGFVDPQPYFEQRIGMSYRTVRKRLAILEALQALPAADQERAKEAVIALGSHKGAVLAPIMAREPATWEKWVAFAQQATEEAIQVAVSDATGARPRGKTPEDRFYRFLLANVPPDLKTRVEAVFEGLMRLTDPMNPTAPMAAFLVLVELGAQELAAHGKWKGE